MSESVEIARKWDIHRAEGLLTAFFGQHPSPVFRLADLKDILDSYREEWGLKVSVSSVTFVRYLIERHHLREITFKLPHRREKRYVWGEVSRYHLAVSMKPKGYLSHYSAVALLGLTEQVPKTIYVNHEQRPQPAPMDGLAQSRIDVAFRRPQRKTKNQTTHEGFTYCYINGKFTHRLGVIEMKDEFGVSVSVTGLERALIDIAVRPAYAGGVSEVLKAYQNAASDVSLNVLAATLTKMDYVYPYHQAIGFYLERSGFPIHQIRKHKVFRVPKDGFNFYLAHQIGETDFNEDWRLFIPKGL